MDLKTALHNLVDLLTLHPSSAAQAHDTIDQIEHTEKAPEVPASVATNVAMGVPKEETDEQS